MRSIDLPNPTIYRQQVRNEAPVLPSCLISVLDDILHVRLQTLGVTEHSFDINIAGNHYTWILYDVGGAVSCYHSCLYPVFVDVSYLFLAERPGKQPDLATTKRRHILYSVTTASCLGALL